MRHKTNNISAGPASSFSTWNPMPLWHFSHAPSARRVPACEISGDSHLEASQPHNSCRALIACLAHVGPEPPTGSLTSIGCQFLSALTRRHSSSESKRREGAHGGKGWGEGASRRESRRNDGGEGRRSLANGSN